MDFSDLLSEVENIHRIENNVENIHDDEMEELIDYVNTTKVVEQDDRYETLVKYCSHLQYILLNNASINPDNIHEKIKEYLIQVLKFYKTAAGFSEREWHIIYCIIKAIPNYLIKENTRENLFFAYDILCNIYIHLLEIEGKEIKLSYKYEKMKTSKICFSEDIN